VEANLAVLIDFENIAAGTEKEGLGRFDIDALMQRVKDKGRILVSRSYADWGRFSRFKQALLACNVTMMELTSHGMQDKNRADIAMVVDALELAFTRAYIDTFVVVSGDSDFTPMVLKMRELNKRVIGIGTRKSTSRLLIQACDEFLFYDTIVQPKSKQIRRKSPGQRDDVTVAFDLVEQAIDGLQRENPDPPLASVVKSAMLRKSPDFNEIELGFSTFARFLETAQEAGVVRIIRDQKSGGYRVDTLEEGERPALPAANDTNGASDNWNDEYLPAGTEKWLTLLAQAGIPPLSASTRMDVLEALVSTVIERAKKRRKSTLQFVREDMKKKLRRTHADLPNNHLRDLLDSLMNAGELIHRDGSAIRSGTAPFVIHKDAAELNESIVRRGLGALQAAGADLSDTGALAALFYGDADRRREVEENLAYLATAGSGDDLDSLDLDHLLVPASGAGAGADDVTAESEEAPKRKRARRKKKDDETEDLPELDDDALLAAEAPTATDTTGAEAAPEAGADGVPARRVRKRPKPTAEELSDLDALLQGSGDDEN
jgi:uncharacterized LabA/DUF88 family protein